MSNRNILITATTYPRWSGDATPDFVRQFALHVANEKNTVTVLAPHARGAKVHENDDTVEVRRYRYFIPASAQDITYNGGGVDKIKKTPLYGLKLLCLLAALFFQSLWQVLRGGIDVLNPHWIVPQGFVAVIVKLLTGRKVVLTAHGDDVFSLNGAVMTRIKRFVLKRSDVVCVNSNATRKACEAIYPRQYEVIPMGIDMERFRPQKPARQLVERYGLNGFSILFVGRMNKVKGVKYLVEALRRLSDEGHPYKAILVGDGPLKSEFETYVADHRLQDKIIFPGWVNQEELNDHYSIADIMVGPSLREAQGLVFVEALASGTPVIASRVGGIVDIVTDGETGYLVEPRSSDALYEKLKYLLDNPGKVKELSQKARTSVESRFSWESVAKQYSKILEEVTLQ